jgi:hypothetical protein
VSLDRKDRSIPMALPGFEDELPKLFIVVIVFRRGCEKID